MFRIVRFMLLFVVVVALAAGAYVLLSQNEYMVYISESEIERIVDERYPFEVEQGILTLHFSNPQVSMLPAEDRISLSMDISARLVMIQAGEGSLSISGALEYRPATHSLHMVESKVDDLSATGLSERAQGPLRAALDVALGEYFEQMPLYELVGGDWATDLSRRYLKEIRIQRGRVALVFSLR